MQMTRVRKLTLLAMFIAVSYVAVTISHFTMPPVFAPIGLKYDPKDIIIVMGGLILGPIAVVCSSVVVSFFEMITYSSTGPVGFLMNVISTCAFALPAAIIYKKMHNIKGATIGLLSGVVLMTGFMILWNYIITPIYMNLDRSIVVGFLIPVFLPFNLVKSALNMAATLLIYKPIVGALRKAKLIPAGVPAAANGTRKLTVGTMVVSAVIFCTCVLLFLSYAKII